MLFEIKMEVKDSAVTLSAALARYMVRHSQGKEKELRVMPFRTTVRDCNYCDVCVSDDPATCPAEDVYGWDINPEPEATGLPRDYVDQLEVLQWNDEDRCVGFLMDNPNVVGLLTAYGMRDNISESMDTGAPVRMMVRPRMWHGRMQYMIERTRWDDMTLCDMVELWWSRWLVKMGM